MPTAFGRQGPEVQILSPRPVFSSGINICRRRFHGNTSRLICLMCCIDRLKLQPIVLKTLDLPTSVPNNRPTAFIAARMFQCLLLVMRRPRSIYLPLTRSGVFMIISSIEDSVVFKRIFDHLDQRAEKQPLALRLAVRAPPACSLDL